MPAPTPEILANLPALKSLSSLVVPIPASVNLNLALSSLVTKYSVVVDRPCAAVDENSYLTISPVLNAWLGA